MVSAEFLGNVPILAALTLDQLETLLPKFRPHHYRRGEVIFHQDDPSDRLHVTVEGTVIISITSEDGREQDIAVIRPGGCFGEMALLDGSARSATATAVEETETLALFREDFLQLLQQYPGVGRDIATLLTRRLRHSNERLSDIVGLDVPTRVAKVLVALSEIYAGGPEPGGIVVPLTQDELARLVGASRETVSRTLISYRSQGILTTSHRRIVITDLNALEQLTCSY